MHLNVKAEAFAECSADQDLQLKCEQQCQECSACELLQSKD